MGERRQQGRPSAQTSNDTNPEFYRQTEQRNIHFSYIQQMNALLAMSEQDLWQWAEDVQAQDEEENRTAQSWLDAGELAELEPEDEDAWELGEAEWASDDWDELEAGDDRDRWLDEPETPRLPELATARPPMRPSLVVDIEPSGRAPSLVTHLAHGDALGELLSRLRQQGREELASALAMRLKTLLELGRILVAYQQPFLLHKERRKPLLRTELAELWEPAEQRKLKDKEAIISRLMPGKSLETPWGDVMLLSDLMPSRRECWMEAICDILTQHERDQMGTAKGVLKVAEIAAKLREAAANKKGLSTENVQSVMQDYHIPRRASERQQAYEKGTAWWIVRETKSSE